MAGMDFSPEKLGENRFNASKNTWLQYLYYPCRSDKIIMNLVFFEYPSLIH